MLPQTGQFGDLTFPRDRKNLDSPPVTVGADEEGHWSRPLLAPGCYDAPLSPCARWERRQGARGLFRPPGVKMKVRRNSFLLISVLLVSLVLSDWGAAYAADKGSGLGGEVGILAGALLADEDLTGESGTLAPTIGLRGGSVFTQRWIWFVDALYSRVGTDSYLEDATLYWGRTGLEWLFVKKPRSSWFVNGAFGWVAVDYENGTVEDFHRPLVSAGFGQRYPMGGRKQLRWELRADVTVDSHPGLDHAVMSQGLAMVGLIWGPSARTAVDRDEDRDGVRNSRDRCPLTPTGATVDRHGCPMDSDGDSVADGIDDCAMTQFGELVNDAGCPRDSDGDRVYDGSDACPDTAEGLTVDEWGCALDRDRDGVPDALDDCPRTLLGIEVDDQGCAMDSDADGIANGLDRCPDTPESTVVDSKGCTASRFLWVPETRTLIVWIEFEVNSVNLDDEAKLLLDEVVPVIVESSYRFEIGGHIDTEVGESDLDRLSSKRAVAVRDYLVEQSVAAHRLETRGYGASVPETAPASRFGGGRVEFKRID